MPTGRYTPHIRPDGSQVNGHREQAFDKYGLPPRDHCGERVRPDRPFRRLRSRDRATPWHFTPLLERYRVDRRAPPEGGSHTWSAPPARPTASPTAESPGSSVGAPSFLPPRARSDRRRGTDLRPPFMRREVFRLRSDAPCCSPDPGAEGDVAAATLRSARGAARTAGPGRRAHRSARRARTIASCGCSRGRRPRADDRHALALGDV